MFADPFVLSTTCTALTQAGNISMPCIGRGPDKSAYRYTDADYNVWDLTIGHQATRRNRVTARLAVSGLTPNLLVDETHSVYSQAIYVVGDFPLSGSVNSAAYTDPTLFETMVKGIGGLLIGLNAADPLFMRIIKGET
jgi:hypothetical protein